MKKNILFLVLITIFLVAACSGGADEEAAQTDNSPRLREDYSDALSVEEQLIVGTLNLEETELAVDEAQAQTLLPLWRALQSLKTSETTAAAELTAVVNQIQDNMTTEQIEAIAAMELTADDIQTALQNAGGAFGFRGANGDGAVDGGFGFPGGGPPGDVVVVPGGGFGGPPGGGFGGGPGGSGGFGGGPSGFGGNADPNAIATRQAQFESGDFQIDSTFLINPLITLLEVRAGEREAPQPGEGGFFRGDFFGQAMEVITAETGLSIEEIQVQQAEGRTLAEIIEANGGDVEAIKAALHETLADVELPEGQTLEDLIDNILG